MHLNYSIFITMLFIILFYIDNLDHLDDIFKIKEFGFSMVNDYSDNFI
jgi:hypothetical protein